MNLGGAIRKARKARGWTLDDLAERTGSDPGNLSRLERGQQGVSQDLLIRILTALEIPLLESISSLSNITDGPLPLVPVLCWPDLSSQIERMSAGISTGAAELVACPVSHSPKTFALAVRGDSMASQQGRSFQDGDIIYVDPDKPPQHHSFVVAQLAGAEDAVFRQIICEGRSRYLKALNPAWPGGIIELPADAVVFGTVIFKGEVI